MTDAKELAKRLRSRRSAEGPLILKEDAELMDAAAAALASEKGEG